MPLTTRAAIETDAKSLPTWAVITIGAIAVVLAVVTVYVVTQRWGAWTGADGPPGLQGLPADHMWYDGDGAPQASLGREGDFYLATVTDEVYVKEGGAWDLVGQLKTFAGPAGERGVDGQRGVNGVTWFLRNVPAIETQFNNLGETGDIFLQPNSTPQANAMWVKQSTGMWASAGNLGGAKGPQGPQGVRGHHWLRGTGDPSPASLSGAEQEVNAASVGDFFLNINTMGVWEKTGASVWTPQGDLKGGVNKGPTGVNGIKWFTGVFAPPTTSNPTGAVTGDYYMQKASSSPQDAGVTENTQNIWQKQSDGSWEQVARTGVVWHDLPGIPSSFTPVNAPLNTIVEKSPGVFYPGANLIGAKGDFWMDTATQTTWEKREVASGPDPPMAWVQIGEPIAPPQGGAPSSADKNAAKGAEGPQGPLGLQGPPGDTAEDYAITQQSKDPVPHSIWVSLTPSFYGDPVFTPNGETYKGVAPMELEAITTATTSSTLPLLASPIPANDYFGSTTPPTSVTALVQIAKEFTGFAGTSYKDREVTSWDFLFHTDQGITRVPANESGAGGTNNANGLGASAGTGPGIYWWDGEAAVQQVFATDGVDNGDYCIIPFLVNSLDHQVIPFTGSSYTNVRASLPNDRFLHFFKRGSTSFRTTMFTKEGSLGGPITPFGSAATRDIDSTGINDAGVAEGNDLWIATDTKTYILEGAFSYGLVYMSAPNPNYTPWASYYYGAPASNFTGNLKAIGNPQNMVFSRLAVTPCRTPLVSQYASDPNAGVRYDYVVYGVSKTADDPGACYASYIFRSRGLYGTYAPNWDSNADVTFKWFRHGGPRQTTTGLQDTTFQDIAVVAPEGDGNVENFVVTALVTDSNGDAAIWSRVLVHNWSSAKILFWNETPTGAFDTQTYWQDLFNAAGSYSRPEPTAGEIMTGRAMVSSTNVSLSTMRFLAPSCGDPALGFMVSATIFNLPSGYGSTPPALYSDMVPARTYVYSPPINTTFACPWHYGETGTRMVYKASNGDTKFLAEYLHLTSPPTSIAPIPSEFLASGYMYSILYGGSPSAYTASKSFPVIQSPSTSTAVTWYRNGSSVPSKTRFDAMLWVDDTGASWINVPESSVFALDSTVDRDLFGFLRNLDGQPSSPMTGRTFSTLPEAGASAMATTGSAKNPNMTNVSTFLSNGTAVEVGDLTAVPASGSTQPFASFVALPPQDYTGAAWRLQKTTLGYNSTETLNLDTQRAALLTNAVEDSVWTPAGAGPAYRSFFGPYHPNRPSNSSATAMVPSPIDIVQGFGSYSDSASPELVTLRYADSRAPSDLLFQGMVEKRLRLRVATTFYSASASDAMNNFPVPLGGLTGYLGSFGVQFREETDILSGAGEGSTGMELHRPSAPPETGATYTPMPFGIMEFDFRFDEATGTGNLQDFRDLTWDPVYLPRGAAVGAHPYNYPYVPPASHALTYPTSHYSLDTGGISPKAQNAIDTQGSKGGAATFFFPYGALTGHSVLLDATTEVYYRGQDQVCHGSPVQRDGTGIPTPSTTLSFYTGDMVSHYSSRTYPWARFAGIAHHLTIPPPRMPWVAPRTSCIHSRGSILGVSTSSAFTLPSFPHGAYGDSSISILRFSEGSSFTASMNSGTSNTGLLNLANGDQVHSLNLESTFIDVNFPVGTSLGLPLSGGALSLGGSYNVSSKDIARLWLSYGSLEAALPAFRPCATNVMDSGQIQANVSQTDAPVPLSAVPSSTTQSLWVTLAQTMAQDPGFVLSAKWKDQYASSMPAEALPVSAWASGAALANLVFRTTCVETVLVLRRDDVSGLPCNRGLVVPTVAADSRTPVIFEVVFEGKGGYTGDDAAFTLAVATGETFNAAHFPSSNHAGISGASINKSVTFSGPIRVTLGHLPPTGWTILDTAAVAWRGTKTTSPRRQLASGADIASYAATGSSMVTSSGVTDESNPLGSGDAGMATGTTPTSKASWTEFPWTPFPRYSPPYRSLAWTSPMAKATNTFEEVETLGIGQTPLSTILGTIPRS